jgi:hypothetical protein
MEPLKKKRPISIPRYSFSLHFNIFAMAAENWQLRHGITKSIAYLPQDPPIAAWTKLQIPRTKTLDANYWNTIFQPLVHPIGHHETVWARVPGNPDVVLLATCEEPLITI